MSESVQRRSRQPGPTREQLLEAARRCVREKGLVGATSREITAAAGANLGAITYHFGSKDELLAEALFTEIERRVRPALDRLALASAANPAEALLRTVQELLADFERSRADTGVYLEALLLAARPATGEPAAPGRHQAALALHNSLAGRLADLVARLQADGTIPAWVEPAAMAALIMAVAQGIALQSHLDPGGPPPAALAGQFAGLLLSAARTRDERG